MRYIQLAVAGMLVSGCAATRSTIDLNVLPADERPATGNVYVRIVQVTDRRTFASNLQDPSNPSLPDEGDIRNPAVTARAIARKRGTFAVGTAEVLLPEGRTVAQVVREAATKALRERGYAVVGENSPSTAIAMPLNLDVQKFWSWTKPGFSALTLTFESELAMHGDMLVGGRDVVVHSHTEADFGVVTDGGRQKFIQSGVNELVRQIKDAIRAP